MRLPLGKNGALRRVHLAVLLDARHIYPRLEANDGGPLRIIWAAMNLNTVDAVLVHRLQGKHSLKINTTRGEKGKAESYAVRPNNGSHPGGELNVVAPLKTIAHRPVADSFLALVELVQQSEVSWHYDDCKALAMSPSVETKTSSCHN